VAWRRKAVDASRIFDLSQLVPAAWLRLRPAHSRLSRAGDPCHGRPGVRRPGRRSRREDLAERAERADRASLDVATSLGLARGEHPAEHNPDADERGTDPGQAATGGNEEDPYDEDDGADEETNSGGDVHVCETSVDQGKLRHVQEA
jgi:hypothetical protein